MSEQKKVSQNSFFLNLFADYHQIYLRDEELEDDTPDDWGEQLTTQMIAVAQGIIGISTARNTRVPVYVALFDSQPDSDFTHWDHVAEASIRVPSGQLVIAGGSDYLPQAKRISVLPGSYRVRVYYGNLEGIMENGIEGEDHYHIILWPEKYRPPEILKRWASL